MLAKPCGQVVVVDEDIMSHAQLGDGNLLIMPSTTAGELEVEADHLVLVLGKQLLHSLGGALHRDRLVRVHHREGLPPHVGVHYVMRDELPAVVVGGHWERHWSHECPLCMCCRGC